MLSYHLIRITLPFTSLILLAVEDDANQRITMVIPMLWSASSTGRIPFKDGKVILVDCQGLAQICLLSADNEEPDKQDRLLRRQADPEDDVPDACKMSWQQ